MNEYLRYENRKGKNIDLEIAKKQIVDFIENDEFEKLNDKPRIILVSKEYQPEVTSTVLWLRKFNVDITCVKLTPYSISQDHLAFESNIIIPLPDAKDFIISSEKKSSAEHKTLSQDEYDKFYVEIINRLKGDIPISYNLPSGRSYYAISVNLSGAHLELAFHGKPRSSFGVELHFEKDDKESNLKFIEYFEKFVPKLEQSTGEKVIVQKDWGTRWTRLYIEKPEGKMTEELKSWAVEKMKIFYKILKPEIDQFKRIHA